MLSFERLSWYICFVFVGLPDLIIIVKNLYDRFNMLICLSDDVRACLCVL